MTDIGGIWAELTAYLKNNGAAKIVLTDDEIQKIVSSKDSRRPYPLDFHDKNQQIEYSIRNRAKEAGYMVNFSPDNKEVKIFTKN